MAETIILASIADFRVRGVMRPRQNTPSSFYVERAGEAGQFHYVCPAMVEYGDRRINNFSTEHEAMKFAKFLAAEAEAAQLENAAPVTIHLTASELRRISAALTCKAIQQNRAGDSNEAALLRELIRKIDKQMAR